MGADSSVSALAGASALDAASAPSTAGTRAPAEARKAAENFTAFFFSQSLDSMFANVGSDGLFGGGSGEAIYRSLMVKEYGKLMARSSGNGVTDAVQRQIIALQEVS